MSIAFRESKRSVINIPIYPLEVAINYGVSSSFFEAFVIILHSSDSSFLDSEDTSRQELSPFQTTAAGMPLWSKKKLVIIMEVTVAASPVKFSMKKVYVWIDCGTHPYVLSLGRHTSWNHCRWQTPRYGYVYRNRFPCCSGIVPSDEI